MEGRTEKETGEDRGGSRMVMLNTSGNFQFRRDKRKAEDKTSWKNIVRGEGTR